MDNLTKPSITRLARRSGVKSLSDDCYPAVRSLAEKMLTELIDVALVVNNVHQTRTLMVDDIYAALRLHGHHVAQSSSLGTTTCAK